MKELVYLGLAVLTGVAYPLYALITGRKTREYLTNFPENKISCFKQVIALQWVFLSMIIGSLLWFKDPLGNIGLAFVHHPLLLPGLLVSIGLVMWIVQLIKVSPDKLPSLDKQLAELSYLLPGSNQEYGWTLVLSVTAGICEEIIFRGFLYHQVNVFLGVIPSILLVNILFAVAHSGTKLKNSIHSFWLGIAWSATYYFTGSLWLAIFTHALVDIYSASLGLAYFRCKHETV